MAETETAESTEQVEDKTDEIPQEAIDVNTKFDQAVADEVDEDEQEEKAEKTDGKADDKTETDEKTEEKTDDKTEEKAADEETPAEEETKAKADDTDSGKVEKTVVQEDVPDDSLLERAVKVGVPFSLAKKATPTELETIVADKEKKADETEEKKPETFDCGIDPKDENWDPKVVDLLNKFGQRGNDLEFKMERMAEDHKKAIEDSAKTQDSATVKQGAIDHENFMNSQFDGLDGFEKIFGKGKTSEMKGTPEAEHRQDIADEMYAIALGIEDRNKINPKKAVSMPTTAELFKRAVKTLHGKETKQAADDKTVKALKKQTKQTIGTGSTGGDAATKMEKAVKVNKDFDAKVNEEVDD